MGYIAALSLVFGLTIPYKMSCNIYAYHIRDLDIPSFVIGGIPLAYVIDACWL